MSEKAVPLFFSIAHPEADAEKKLPANHFNELLSSEQWGLCQQALAAAEESQSHVMLGGAIALGSYTGRWRNTKDLDFFVQPEKRDALIGALTAAGFVDYYDQVPYDRSWIYRAFKEGLIVDVIWTLPNHRTIVDADWEKHAPPFELGGYSLRVIPAEELLWIKLYVLQRDRCDWPDIFNLLHAAGPQFDWDRLIRRLGPDLPLLQAALTVFAWLSPERSRDLPSSIRKRFRLSNKRCANSDEKERQRVSLLDSRPWFAAHQPEGKPMEL